MLVTAKGNVMLLKWVQASSRRVSVALALLYTHS